MNETQRYLAEEIALDQADGLIPRREALRRLGLMGITGVAASSLLLAACSQPRQGQAPPLSGSSGGVPPTAAPVASITFAGPEGRTLQATFAAAEKPRGAVLVVHENKGLTEHFQKFPGRFAAAGYSALAVDLLSAEGGTASLGDPANATAALGKVAPERFVVDMKAALDELQKRTPEVKLGAIGFCFGGGMVWRLLASREPRLAAAAPFYGPLPEGADFSGSGAAVLGIYAERDDRVNASRDRARAALEKAGLTHEIATFSGADHAFFNDTGPRYSADAARDAWGKVLGWFGRHVG